MNFYPGFEIAAKENNLGFIYGNDTFGPEPELRCLEDIRSSLAEPDAKGPEILYCIAMDVGMKKDRADLTGRGLLYGAVTYSAGMIGREPVRSQGHIHAVSASCGTSTCELYEIWEGAAYIYMQESGEDIPGRCFAVYAKAGDVVLVPPGMVHATVNADISRKMSFGAWCIRDYGFDYEQVRAHHGIAYFPKVNKEDGDRIVWEKNPAYHNGYFQPIKAEELYEIYKKYGFHPGVPIYKQYQNNREQFRFVTSPQEYEALWRELKTI